MTHRTKPPTLAEQVINLKIELDHAKADLARAQREAGKLQGQICEARESARDAATRGYTMGHADGFQAGAFAALCRVDPDHPRALSLVHVEFGGTRGA